jgi:GTPase-associated protein 1
MTFQQLYYTSCENGLAGYGGYQFNAVTPGVSPAVMREIEDRTVYEPPRWLAADGCPDEPEAYPVAFSYGLSEATGAAVTTHAVAAGADYSGRPGNYFVHALVTPAPEPDFGPVLPVELWGAGLWRRTPVHDPDLPALPGPPPRGVVDRAGVAAFLDARGGQPVLAELVTAAAAAMAGARPVLIASEDAGENIWWIASVCYLLGDSIGRRLTFTTYSHRPGYCRYHLIGTVPDSMPPDARESFQTFDLVTGETPGTRSHPLATLLAGVGVMGMPALWQQAAAFATGDETSLDDWLPLVAVAAGLLGGRLSAPGTDAVANWLPGAAGRLSAQHAAAALGVALAQPGEELTSQRLRGLLGLARRLPDPSHTELLERLLAERALARLARGEPADPVRLTTRVAELGQAWAVRILASAPPAAAAAVLEWAAASALPLPAGELERYGRALPLSTPGGELARILPGRPAIVRGLLEQVAGQPVAVAQGLLGGPLSGVVTRDDLAPHPGLTEIWLMIEVARGQKEPMRAFDEIVDLRAAAGRSPRFDQELLRRLWPGGCPADQLAELLAVIGGDAAPGVVAWLAAEIGVAAARPAKKKDDWLPLAQALAGHPVLPRLPTEISQATLKTATIAPLLHRAAAAAPDGDVAVFAELYGAYSAADRYTRGYLERRLPGLLALARPDLGPALRDCPQPVADAFGRHLGSLLSPLRADIALAVRVFTALGHPDVLAQPAVAATLTAAFEQVHTWRRRDLSALARALDGDDDTAYRFQVWRDDHRGLLGRLLHGGGAAPAPGEDDPPADRRGPWRPAAGG